MEDKGFNSVTEAMEDAEKRIKKEIEVEQRQYDPSSEWSQEAIDKTIPALEFINDAYQAIARAAPGVQRALEMAKRGDFKGAYSAYNEATGKVHAMSYIREKFIEQCTDAEYGSILYE